MRTVATFRGSGFNTAQPKPHFINPGAFGDDVARWLIVRLRDAGAPTDDQPNQEDFGWYFNFAVPEGLHTCVVALRPSDGGGAPEWVIWTERLRGLVGSLIGARSRGIAPSAVALLHYMLSTAPEVTHLRWHDRRAFDAGRDEEADSEPWAGQ